MPRNLLLRGVFREAFSSPTHLRLARLGSASLVFVVIVPDFVVVSVIVVGDRCCFLLGFLISVAVHRHYYGSSLFLTVVH